MPVLTALLITAASCTSTPSGTERSPQLSSSWPTELSDTLQGERLLVGRRFLDDDDWAPIDQPVAFGVEFEWRPQGGVVGIEAGLSGSGSTRDMRLDVEGVGAVDTEVNSTLAEVYVGARFTTPMDMWVRPYAGIGIGGMRGGISTEADFGSAGGSAYCALAYVHGGATIALGESFEVGADVRAVVTSDLDLLGSGRGAHYLQFGLFFGHRF